MSLLLYCLLIPAISAGYIYFYNMTRKSAFTVNGSHKKIALVILYNYLILRVVTGIGNCFTPFIIISILIADIDILIGKIPSELLAAAMLAAIPAFIEKGINFPVMSAAFLAAGAVFHWREKIGIAAYDVFLIFMLSLLLEEMIGIMKFYSIFMILWGITGSLVKTIKKEERCIPLAPLIFISYLAVCNFIP